MVSCKRIDRFGFVFLKSETWSPGGYGEAQSLPEEILEVGDKIVVFVHYQAWPRGGGQPIEGRIADVHTVQDGKVVQIQAYSDPEEARKAVGLSPNH